MAAIAALAVTAVAAAVQYRESKKQQDLSEQQAAESERQAALAQQRADYQATRQQRAQIRAARVQRAEVVNKAAQTGTQFSTATEGATASLETQLASNLGYLETEKQYGREVFASTARQLGLEQEIGQSKVRSGAARGVGAISGTIFSDLGGYKGLFSKSPSGDTSGGYGSLFGND